MTKSAGRNEVVLCIEPHVGRLDGQEYVAHLGELFRSDDPIVLQTPLYFAPEPPPGEELPRYE
jgi:hypothetical protein